MNEHGGDADPRRADLQVLIDRIMREAEEIVGSRLAGFVQGRVPA
jgi:hypothetical protein